MKQTLEEAAYDYATNKTKFRKEVLKEVDPDNYISRESDCMEDFQCGAEWHARQPLWISVEERLPEDFQEVLILRTYIGAKSRERRYEVFTQTFFKEYGFEICETRKELKEKVLAWMPIPSFDEILEVNRDVLERIKKKEVNHG